MIEKFKEKSMEKLKYVFEFKKNSMKLFHNNEFTASQTLMEAAVTLNGGIKQGLKGRS